MPKKKIRYERKNHSKHVKKKKFSLWLLLPLVALLAWVGWLIYNFTLPVEGMPSPGAFWGALKIAGVMIVGYSIAMIIYYMNMK